MVNSKRRFYPWSSYLLLLLGSLALACGQQTSLSEDKNVSINEKGISHFSSESKVAQESDFQLTNVEELPGPRNGKLERYISSSGARIDLFFYWNLKGPLGGNIDQESTSFLATLPSLKMIGMYESIYPETSQETYIQIGEQRLRAKKIILRAKTQTEEIRSFYLVVKTDPSELVKFRYSSPLEKFDEEVVEKFIKSWLEKRLSSYGKSSQSGKRNNQSFSITKKANGKYQGLKKKYRGRSLGHFDPEMNIAVFNRDLMKDYDLGLAVATHELSHGAFSTEESIDKQITKLTTKFGVRLHSIDIEVWGKRELVADLTTLAVLAGLGKREAIRKYATLRGIRDEIIEPFLDKTWKTLQTNED